MTNNCTTIDEKLWPRSAHCAAFRNCVEPAFCVTFETDVTGFRQRVRERASRSPWRRCARRRTASRISATALRTGAAFTFLDAETELFKVMRVPFEGSMEEFARKTSRAAREQEAYFTGSLENDVFQCSPLPWLSFTHISHTNSGRKDCATPLFDWGKFIERGGRMVMPVSVQTHHSFVDGLHVARFAERLQAFFDGGIGEYSVNALHNV